MSCKAMDGEGFVTLSEESTADRSCDALMVELVSWLRGRVQK